jgi:hypothetical protein
VPRRWRAILEPRWSVATKATATSGFLIDFGPEEENLIEKGRAQSFLKVTLSSPTHLSCAWSESLTYFA